MRYGFIYETTNLLDGKKYIGKHKRTQNPNDSDDSWYLGSGKYLVRAIEKYGAENFSRKIICECDSEEELQEKERYYIKLYGAVESDKYYNLVEDANPPRNNHSFGDSVRGRRSVYLGDNLKYVKVEDLESYLSNGWSLGLPESHKRKLRECHREATTLGTIRIHRGDESKCVYPEELEEYISSGWIRGLSDKVKESISKSNKGKNRSEDTKQKIRNSSIGVKHSEATKINISTKISKLWEDEEYRKKQSDSHRGYIVPDDTRKKISESNKGREHSNDTRLLISERTKEAMNSPEVKKHLIESRKNFKVIKICAICHREYTARSNRSKYCSECRR